MEREHRITQRHIDYLISLEKRGRMTAEEVLADAKQPESVLHDLFDWDVARAAEQFWLDRTRAIIRVVRVVVYTEQQTYRLPRYVHDPTLVGREQGYISLETVKVDPQLARQTLTRELQRVTSALERAKYVAAALGLESDVDELLATVTGLRASFDDDEHEVQTAAAPPPPA